MKKKIAILVLALGLGAALGAAQRVRAEGVCVISAADVQLQIASVTIEGVDSQLVGAPSALVFKLPSLCIK